MQNAKSAPVANDFNDTCFHWDGVGATMNGARHHFVQQKRYLFKKNNFKLGGEKIVFIRPIIANTFAVKHKHREFDNTSGYK